MADKPEKIEVLNAKEHKMRLDRAKFEAMRDALLRYCRRRHRV